MNQQQLLIEYDASPFAELVHALVGRNGAYRIRRACACRSGYGASGPHGGSEVV
jgi:hypothetical protein